MPSDRTQTLKQDNSNRRLFQERVAVIDWINRARGRTRTSDATLKVPTGGYRRSGAQWIGGRAGTRTTWASRSRATRRTLTIITLQIQPFSNRSSSFFWRRRAWSSTRRWTSLLRTTATRTLSWLEAWGKLTACEKRRACITTKRKTTRSPCKWCGSVRALMRAGWLLQCPELLLVKDPLSSKGRNLPPQEPSQTAYTSCIRK